MKEYSLDFKMIESIIRKKNREQYCLLAICQFLSVLMVTSFSIMLTSNTVLNVLPEGGDSRKQMYMIFVASLFGCGMFLLYAAGLFFRYKSKEIGVFLALGARKKQMTSMLEWEVGMTGLVAGLFGLILALPLDFLLWSIFRLFVPNSEEMVFSMQPKGYVWGIAFLICTFLLYEIKCRLYIKQTNLIEILHEEERTEPVRDVKSWYGIGGILLMATGCFFGYIRDVFCLHFFNRLAPDWTLIFYTLIPVGLYLFLCYTIIHGWGKRAAYKHIISHSMMKFQGRQTVRNMIVIAILTVAGFFAIFYLPTLVTGAFYEYGKRPYDYYFHYRADQDMISMEEIENLADREQVEITKKEEAEILTLARDGYERDYDEKGRLVEQYRSPYVEESVVSRSEYNRITGQNLSIDPGKYAFVRVKGESDHIFSDFDRDISYLENPVTKERIQVSVQKNVSACSEVFYHYFVLNDPDYNRLKKGLTDEWRENMILFNVKKEKESYPFAKKLYDEIIKRSGREVCVFDGYDRIVKEWEEKENGYYYADHIEEFRLDYSQKNSTDFTMYWKYYPAFRVMDQQEMVTRFAVFLMLFAFISVILFASVILVAHTRCLSIAMNNKKVYQDVEHLGASKKFLRKEVKYQISKIFFVPAAIGTVLIYFFYVLIMIFNSGVGLSTSELLGLFSDLFVIAIAGGIMYAVYRSTLKKVWKLLQIEGK